MSAKLASLYYEGQEKLLVAVDCIVFGFDEGQLKLLLFQRPVKPLKGQWSLVGRFINPSENLDDGAKRVLFESTGLQEVFMQQMYCYGGVDRDPGGRVLSIVYIALIRVEEQDVETVENYGAHWFNFEDKPDLILDHEEMVQMALDKLRRKARYRPIGFELLPEKFTLPKLQHLYEAIYQQEFDKRNFRKKILSMGLLEKLPEKDKSGSKKGAFLYRFDKEKYETLLAKGFNFEL